jgi:glycosyltransferase involved in cell wall biosynthesis
MPTGAPKAKVLHVITRSIIGGAQDNTFCTCERHDRRRYEVHLACNPDGRWIERARRAGDVLHPVPALVRPVQPWHDLRALLALVRLMRRERFDVVHTHTAKAGFLGRLAARQCRVPAVVHTYHAFPWHDRMSAAQRQLYLRLERVVRPFTHCALTVSETQRQAGARLRVLDAERSRTIYSGIDFAKLDAAAAPAVTRAKLGLPPDAPLIIFAGRLDPSKAPHLLVAAFSQVAQEHPDARLLLAGDGELRAALEAQVRALGLAARVHLLGFRDDVPDLLRAADVFAFSSLWEMLGRALTEAMLLGKAVVAPALNGIPEIVRHGETGLLYEAGQSGQLAQHLGHLLANAAERERLGANARRLTRPMFDVNVMVARIEQVYEELLPTPVLAPAFQPPAAKARAA